ncbi:MAG: hypothetical protein RIS36_1684 [Pseudomonadota bacterium]
MIVNYLNIKSVFTVPLKTDSKLVVNPDTVLILSVSLERLESISPELLEILQASSRPNSSQLNPSLLMQL